VVTVQTVEVTSTGPRTVRASAVVNDGASPPYTITFNLNLSHGRWLVTDVESRG
jgi:ABC-type transporter MlaC component